MPRPMNGDEKALWSKVIATVKPMHPVITEGNSSLAAVPQAITSPAPQESKPAAAAAIKTAKPPYVAAAIIAAGSVGKLDGSWDKRIGGGMIVPDIHVDLHGQGLSSAYTRLDGALEMAIAQKMRVILLVTGRPRSHDRTSGEGRGAIASVVRDWLAASRHSRSISAVRNAHPKHGGAGALYIVLKR